MNEKYNSSVLHYSHVLEFEFATRTFGKIKVIQTNTNSLTASHEIPAQTQHLIADGQYCFKENYFSHNCYY